MSDDDSANNESRKPNCKYGSKCYRKNADHLRDFFHPPQDVPDPSKKAPDKRHTADKIEEDDVPSKKSKTSPNSFDEKLVEPSVQCPIMHNLTERTKFIKDSFLFEMPNDFFVLWNLCETLKPSAPCDAFEEFGLTLVGPFAALAGKFDLGRCVKRSQFLLAWRFYYDVPEFQTVISGDESTQFHIGYFRDDPNELPSLVCSNEATKGCKMVVMGDNLIGALHLHLTSSVKVIDENKEIHRKVTLMLEELANEHHFYLKPTASQKIKERKKKVVADAFHGAGIVVPVVNDVGYREISETDATLKKWLKIIETTDEDAIRDEKIEKLQEIVNYVQFANDECDYGMGLEFGIDLFCSGCTAVHGLILQLLSVAYGLLKRDKFADILSVHLRHRSKESVVKL